ncbi:serine protease gd-like [Lycorma delicatula]|uniref:serine protease gd-like n=1 Tax=Lycorma delicatula TaxID=130591 RepID=UPI003F5158CB
MIKKFTLLFIIITLFSRYVDSFIPTSPCPDIFKYHQLNISDVWVGLVHIPPPPPPQAFSSIKLNVYLYLEAILPTKYVGILELNEPRKAIAARLAEYIWKPISYIIHFPLLNPLPTVKIISVNNKILCVGPPVISPVITTINLEHTLFPGLRHITSDVIKRKFISYGSNNDGNINDRYPYNSLKHEEICGRAVLPNPLVVGGRPIRQREWPWLVAIFISQSLDLQFHCSATLISNQFVVTAGHCIHHEDIGKLTPNAIFIYLGKFNLKNWLEQDSLLRQALGVYVHPNYNKHNFSSDLALIKFKPVTFTAYIRPACLWSGSSDLNPYIGKIGTVVGWGSSANKSRIKIEPHTVQMRLASQEQCLRSREEFTYLTSDNTLCASNKNGTGPCNGDSGAGLLLLSENTLKWELRGIVSLSLLNTSTQSCDLDEYIIFTDAAKFHDWLTAFVI